MEETIKILINNCYGGYCISNKAFELYNNKMKIINPDFKNIEHYEIKRHDPVIVSVFEELGDEFNSTYSKVKIQNIPKKYENSYDIYEYDGLENISIDENKYKIDRIKEIIRDKRR